MLNLVSSNGRGIFCALLATALFASAAALAKVVAMDYHILQILFFRQIVVFLSSLPAVTRSFPDSLLTRRPLLHACRLSGAFVALSCGLWAVTVLPLTTAVTLGFAQVFFIALLAWLFLKESIGSYRMAAITVGFIGVIVVMRPGVDGVLNVYAFIPIAAALGAAVAMVTVRTLSQSESTATLLLYQSVFVGLLAGIPLYWLWITPDLRGLAYLLGLGLLATVGQWLGVKALRLGEASVIGSIQYMQLIYAAAWGYLLFREIPDQYTLGGAVIIIGTSLYLIHREALVRKTEAEMR